MWWTYRGLYASWFLMHWERLQDQKAFPLPNYVAEHTNPAMWSLPPCHPIELALAKKYFPIEEQEYLKANDDLQRERLLSLATRQAEILGYKPLHSMIPSMYGARAMRASPLSTPRAYTKRGVVSICIQDYAQTGCDQGDTKSTSTHSPQVRKAHVPRALRTSKTFMKLASKSQGARPPRRSKIQGGERRTHWPYQARDRVLCGAARRLPPLLLQA